MKTRQLLFLTIIFLLATQFECRAQYNTFTGVGAGANTTIGHDNVAVGVNALLLNQDGNFNVILGSKAMRNNISGSSNIVFGFDAFNKNVTGSDNIVIGRENGGTLTGGNSNIFIGHAAGNCLASGNGNVFIGGNFSIPQSTLNNTMIFSTNLRGAPRERFRVDSIGNMGIGTSFPKAKLEVNGPSNQSGLRFTNLKSDSPALANTLAPINSKFLTVDTEGDVILQNLPTPTLNPANGAYWGLTGNSGTSATTNFIGTTTNVDLVFRRNNFRSGLIGTTNTSFGLQAIENNTGSNNSAFGVNSLKSNSTGQHNTSVGASSMIANDMGSNNSSFGHVSLVANTNGQQNSAFGARAMGSNISGSNNSALGFGALTANNSNNNSAIGWYALRYSIGSGNIGIGSESGRAFVSGDNNIFLGNFSGSTGFTNGNGNIFIGYNSTLPDGVNNRVNIGNTITGVSISSYPTPLGVAKHHSGKIGIGLVYGVDPGNKLEIRNADAGGDIPNSSGLRFTNLKSDFNAPANTTSGKFLTVNTLGDVVLEKLPIGNGTTTNTLTSSVNTITSTVNGVAAAAPAVNSVSHQLVTGNKLRTLVNGVASNDFQLPSFTEVDGSMTNELQTVAATPTGFTLSNNGGSINFPILSEVDGSVTNELQNLSISGNQLSISNGNGVTLPTYTAGTNVTINNNQINAQNIYTQSGTLNNHRFVGLGGFNLNFGTQGNSRIYIGNSPIYPTTTGDYRLYVEGGILSERVRVALRNSEFWADNVFANDYKLTPLKEIESFIKENKHLPGIESADELVKNGLNLGDMQAKQMGKIEELTLHLIEQNKMLEKQSKEIEELKALVKSLVEKK